MKIKSLLEIACFNIEAAVIAQRAGADRIELCDDYVSGGITPRFDPIKKARELLSISLYVMIRPRGGNFVYSDSEFEKMKSAVVFCRENNVDGIVFGILTDKNIIDKNRCTELIELAKPTKATLHRAFDAAANPPQTLEAAVDCGFTRILTSGQKPSALEGAPLIADLIKKADGRISIMPGGSVRAENISELKSKTKASEFHSSALDAAASLPVENVIEQMKKLISL